MESALKYNIQQTRLPVSTETAWSLLSLPIANIRYSPPWATTLNLSNLSTTELEVGQTFEFQITSGPLKGPLLVEIKEKKNGYLLGTSFKGRASPEITAWTRLLPGEHASECILEDRFEFEKKAISRQKRTKIDEFIRNISYYRHQNLKKDLSVGIDMPADPKRILIAGGSGLVGSHLRALLTLLGHEVAILSTRSDSPTNLYWNPSQGELQPEQLNGFDTIINLSGYNIAERWTSKTKEKIRSSRIESTKLLVDTIRRLENPPECFIQASATGIYGLDPARSADETSDRGTGFLADVCHEWEETAAPLQSIMKRYVCLRLGVVLTPRGGALRKMLPIFKSGIGGKLGSGKQGFPWISNDDLSRLIAYVVHQPTVTGTLNACSPNPITNAVFTQAISKVLKKPAIFPVPAIMLKLIYGQMANETLLGGAMVSPPATIASGYCFMDPEIEDALRSNLGRW